MNTDDASPTFDGRIAVALVVGPLLPLVLYTHAQPLLMPTVIAATVTQFAMQFSRSRSRTRTAVLVAVMGINALGWPLYIIEGLTGV